MRKDQLPETIPIFPLAGTVVLPRGHVPLNIFEPRYLAMVRDAMADERMIGMVQTRDAEFPPGIYEVGGLGRITQFSETDDGRFLIVLTGISRFRVLEELGVLTPYRQVRISCDAYDADLKESPPLPAHARARLIHMLRGYLDRQGLAADWSAVDQANDEGLVNTLAGVCPFDPIEKQALLEAADLEARTETLIALMSFSQPQGGAASPATLQ